MSFVWRRVRSISRTARWDAACRCELLPVAASRCEVAATRQSGRAEKGSGLLGRAPRSATRPVRRAHSGPPTRPRPHPVDREHIEGRVLPEMMLRDAVRCSATLGRLDPRSSGPPTRRQKDSLGRRLVQRLPGGSSASRPWPVSAISVSEGPSAQSPPSGSRVMLRDAARRRAMPRDAVRCRAMPRDAARRRADAVRCPPEHKGVARSVGRGWRRR